MKGRRYKVSLVGFEEPAADGVSTRPHRRAGRGLRRAWSRVWSLSWQLRAAILCMLVGALILVLHFS